MDCSAEPRITLKPGHHYWFQQVHERVWRTAYVFEDHDHNLWMQIMGSDQPWELSKMDLGFFEFREIPRPPEKIMAMEKETFQKLVVLKSRLYNRETGLKFDETRNLAQALDQIIREMEERELPQ